MAAADSSLFRASKLRQSSGRGRERGSRDISLMAGGAFLGAVDVPLFDPCEVAKSTLPSAVGVHDLLQFGDLRNERGCIARRG